MKKAALVLFLFGILPETSISQDSLSNEFSENWQADSTIINGFRSASVVYDSVEWTYLINGVNLNGFKKKQITNFLGSPDVTGTINNSVPFINGFFITVNFPYITKTIGYVITTCSSRNGVPSSSVLTFEIRRNKVYEVSLRDGCAVYRDLH